ncbi:MAG TPA: SIMPL domain-containing protein [Candidatus Binataceae bacterium]
MSALAILASCAGATAIASDNQPQSIRVIEVAGNGQANGTPDTASLSVEIETHATTAEETSSQNAALAEKVMAALKSKLGDKGKITTSGYSLTPDYSEHPGRDKPTIVGYNAQNSIEVETGAMDLLGALIDSAIGAGANRINYLNFSLKEDTKTRTEAIAIASRDAQAQAQALAAALGVKLKRIIKASTVTEPRPMPVYGVSAMAMGRAATPVEPQEITVPATVSLTYEIE